MGGQIEAPDAVIPISGGRLTLPEGPIFHLKRADQCVYELGEFRAWAGYKNFGADEATDGVALFQHVLSFAHSGKTGRTGVHAHLAHSHIVIPTSGRGVFSYDGVLTEAIPGSVIVQHGGTVHDQFEYSYAASSVEENNQTKQFVEPAPPDAGKQSFGFLELFVPKAFANVEIVPPALVSEADQASAWSHPYHLAGCRFAIQQPDAPDAAYHPVAGRGDLEIRDAQTWEPSGRLVATWIIRPIAGAPSEGQPFSPVIVGEAGGFDILYMVGGSASFRKADGEIFALNTGDTLTCDPGAAALPFDCSADMRLLKFFVAGRCERLRRRTREEIDQLEHLGARIITRREVRPSGDVRPINGLQPLD